MAAVAPTQEEELVDYDESQQQQEEEGDAGDKQRVGGNYVGVSAHSFQDFFLKPELLRAINEAGFEHPSEVQHECIPQAITGTDILCQAKSGMGKTAVFVISILQQLNPTEDIVYCLVLGHTRELAYQIKNEFDRFAKHLPAIRTAVVYGGSPEEQDVSMLKDSTKIPHVLIGTPGRVKSLVSKKALNLDKLKFFVVDECDRCLEKEDMRTDIQSIYFMAPKKIQTMMFSATMSPENKAHCKRFMGEPMEISVDSDSKLTLHGLLQYYVKLEEKTKNKKLNDILDKFEFNQIIIFVKSPPRAKALNQLLNDCGFPSTCIFGKMKQEERIEKYRDFKGFKTRIMVATDLFGRGIDIERVNIVVNYDMPDNSDQYLHRVGRAGRFGTKGLAVTFCSSEDDKKVLGEVQSRFEVQIEEMPDHVDQALYINA
uniref:RNA helicase n=1 Tax=Chromera velia CCMP2878 TaxID=1169474 RepID=A0A0G4IB35_9ALVE|mmetsp:Transcript_42036/g.82968  ORF Transcript_42036/g.82968 Transcript_42036/m.82968 type:complete len:428 (+) Transcript_42036:195-1478(+)|eukprot:Cvel_12637.t1-p1 / transcript=Cvel_12637.t1 / gene=Cvel_12637 / organism=Chromera_velia_CCMP2878 / gene_product=ATP-dependent RNA helicase uap56, putative / transcript_product=ATP-dependent RNA helicase uap56, putative / location=Cvel_scaffold834:49456-53611(+) / protein_length=427 / sequence_SO=supercontig / SO=protein_coding / is_pseudo=false